MWKASYSRISARSQCAKCRKFFSSSKFRQTESSGGAAKSAQPPPPAYQPPPIPPKSGGGVFFKLLGLTTLTGGGLVGYAWYDQNFRKTIEDNVPYSKDAFDYIFPYLPDPPTNQAPIPKPIFPVPIPSKKPADSADTHAAAKTAAVQQKVDPALEKQREKQRKERLMKEMQAEEAAENAALEVILESLAEDCTKLTERAVQLQQKVVDSTKSHTQQLKKAMDDTTEILKKDDQWAEVAMLFQVREETSREAKEIVENARMNLEKLRAAIDEGKHNAITKKNESIQRAQGMANKVASQLSQSSAKVFKAESEAKVMSRYKDLVEKGRKQFQQELESIMPEVKPGDRRGKKMSEEELNSLIAHAHRRIEQLQKQLAQQLAQEQLHIEDAIEQQMKEDEKLTSFRVQMEADILEDNFVMEKEKWATEAQVDFEKSLRQQLARQAAAHSDHLKDVLRVQQEELDQVFEREMHTKILEERQAFQTEVAGWIARLKGIESAVDSRAEAEKTARSAQELWLSCIALNGAIRLGREEGVLWEDRIKPLANEIVAISDASGRHPFVETIIRTIPEEALIRGVWTEENLQERFPEVKRICKRVAMIDDEGGSLFKYFLSYFQSFFIFDTLYATSSEDEVDLDNFDTFAILAHAEYWVKKGDMEQAIRFVNQLHGEPKRVASDWLKEAKLMCETRQAAYALMAFASASGLGTLF